MVYDLIILGGGPAGYTAAERAGEAKKKVLLIVITSYSIHYTKLYDDLVTF